MLLDLWALTQHLSPSESVPIVVLKKTNYTRNFFVIIKEQSFKIILIYLITLEAIRDS